MDRTVNFREWIMRAVDVDKIEAVLLNDMGYQRGWDDDRDDVPVLLSWEEASKLFDYKIDTGYGGVDGHRFVIWTAERIYFMGCYDGSQWVATLPRNPTLEIPAAVGGG